MQPIVNSPSVGRGAELSDSVAASRWPTPRHVVIAVMGLSALFVALTFSFVSNGFGVAPWNEWTVWEKGSEAMILQRIEFDLLDRDSSSFGLGPYSGEDYSVYERLASDSLDPSAAPKTFDAYTSEVGGQAYFWSFLWREIGCDSVGCLHLVNSMLFSAVVIAMFLGFGMGVSWWLGVAWLVSAAMSPWFVLAARNLFWSPWLYFLPAIVTFFLLRTETKRAKTLGLAVLFAAFVVKFVASGYHEFTSVIMLAASVPIVAAAFRERRSIGVVRALKDAVAVGLVGGLAMTTVVLLHAYLLSGDVVIGIKRLWTETVVRRTYGTGNVSSEALAEVAEASPWDVLWRFVWSEWWTDLLKISVDASGSLVSFGLGPKAFALLTLLSIIVVVVRMSAGDQRWKRDLTLLIAGFSVAAIWFVSAKSYSYIHWFILFFLWYFLYVPAMVFVIGAFGGEQLQKFSRRSVSWKNRRQAGVNESGPNAFDSVRS